MLSAYIIYTLIHSIFLIASSFAFNLLFSSVARATSFATRWWYPSKKAKGDKILRKIDNSELDETNNEIKPFYGIIIKDDYKVDFNKIIPMPTSLDSSNELSKYYSNAVASYYLSLTTEEQRCLQFLLKERIIFDDISYWNNYFRHIKELVNALNN